MIDYYYRPLGKPNHEQPWLAIVAIKPAVFRDNYWNNNNGLFRYMASTIPEQNPDFRLKALRVYSANGAKYR